MFKNLKVIELASVLAGPAVGMFFAELGATVIKIENKTTKGDVTRSWKLPTEDKNTNISAYYCSVNWNKESLFLDLKNAEDQQKVYDLIAEADIVIANFKHGDAEKLGMNYETIKAFQPNIIYGEITAFGKNEKRLGFDVVLQAEAGFMFMNGEAKGNIVKMPVALIDILTAHQLKEAILLALLKQQMTGKGSYVSVSLMETAIASLANQATNWLMGGHIPQRMGTLHPNIAPYGDIFCTLDEKLLVLAVGNDKQFSRMCDVLQQKDLVMDKRFLNNSLRVKNRAVLQAILKPLFANYLRDNVLNSLIENGIPAAAIRNMQEVFEQKIAQDMVLTQTLTDGTQTRCVKTISFDTTFLNS
ncbi:MAG: CaiB/BaiF CoA transferase family protein [Chitinophagales bacterium]